MNMEVLLKYKKFIKEDRTIQSYFIFYHFYLVYRGVTILYVVIVYNCIAMFVGGCVVLFIKTFSRPKEAIANVDEEVTNVLEAAINMHEAVTCAPKPMEKGSYL
jgi:predicted RNase H-related nuclease YkuK (DUF458 family)